MGLCRRFGSQHSFNERYRRLHENISVLFIINILGGITAGIACSRIAVFLRLNLQYPHWYLDHRTHEFARYRRA
jgi:type IV secretory pathway component VirB8